MEEFAKRRPYTSAYPGGECDGRGAIYRGPSRDLEECPGCDRCDPTWRAPSAIPLALRQGPRVCRWGHEQATGTKFCEGWCDQCGGSTQILSRYAACFILEAQDHAYEHLMRADDDATDIRFAVTDEERERLYTSRAKHMQAAGELACFAKETRLALERTPGRRMTKAVQHNG